MLAYNNDYYHRRNEYQIILDYTLLLYTLCYIVKEIFEIMHVFCLIKIKRTHINGGVENALQLFCEKLYLINKRRCSRMNIYIYIRLVLC